MTPEEIAGIQRREEAFHNCDPSSYQHSPIWRLCQCALTAKRAGAEDALQGMRDWCAKQEESATEEMELAESSGWYEAERELADFRKTYQKVLEHIEQRLAALKEDKTDA